MPYAVEKVEGGYKVKRLPCGCGCPGKFMSSKALTRDTAEKQKKAIEMNESKTNKISPSLKKRLMEHSKAHAGGMKGKHMKNMMKFIKQGDNFTIAHRKAKKLDK